MTEHVRCNSQDITPATDSIADWIKALEGLAKEGCRVLEITCADQRLPAGLLAGIVEVQRTLRSKDCRIRLLNASLAQDCDY